MNRRERLERKIERREAWAASREAKAAAAFTGARESVAGIPFGQPILVGHHSERRHRAALERHDSRMRAGMENEDMANHHASKAAGLAAQLERSIYSDDDNAAEALAARIADLEAQRDRITAYNKSARQAAKRGDQHGDLNILDEKQRAELLNTLRVCPYHIQPGAPMPSYVLSNLSGNIKRNKDRLEQIKRQAERAQAAEESPNGITITGGEYVNVTFADKPEREILTALKAAGFFWSRGCWGGRRDKIPAEVLELTEPQTATVEA